MKNLVLIIFLILSIPGKAQLNLVPNPSFEDTLACPSNISGQYGDEIYNLTNWFPVRNSADFFHTCSSNLNSVPSNAAGYQYPHIGNGYIGLFSIGNFIPFPNYREYVGVQLAQTLIIGIKYFFTMYLTAAFGGQGVYSFSNKVGVKLSTTQFEAQVNPLAPDNISVGFCDSIIQDTTNWTALRFSFVADSAYSFLYLGNFFDDLNTDSIAAFGTAGGIGAYYFIDDVCLSTDSLICEISTGINNSSFPKNEIAVFPNPVVSELNFKNIVTSTEIQLFDCIGSVILTCKIDKDSHVLDLSNLNSGIYFIKIFNEPCNIFKIIKP